MQEPTHLHYSVPSEFVSQHLARSQQRCDRIRELEDDLCELAAHIDAATVSWSMCIQNWKP